MKFLKSVLARDLKAKTVKGDYTIDTYKKFPHIVFPYDVSQHMVIMGIVVNSYNYLEKLSSLVINVFGYQY